LVTITEIGTSQTILFMINSAEVAELYKQVMKQENKTYNSSIVNDIIFENNKNYILDQIGKLHETPKGSFSITKNFWFNSAEKSKNFATVYIDNTLGNAFEYIKRNRLVSGIW